MEYPYVVVPVKNKSKEKEMNHFLMDLKVTKTIAVSH